MNEKKNDIREMEESIIKEEALEESVNDMEEENELCEMDDLGEDDLGPEIHIDEENQVEEKKTRTNSIVKTGVVALVSSVIGASVAILGMKDSNSMNVSAPIIIGEDDSKASGQLNVYQAVAKKASPSVVGIMTTSINNKNIFALPVESSGVGTGVIVDSKGYILTNSHVVSMKGEGEISVVLSDGKSVKGDVLWQDKSLDLAVLKIAGDGYTPAELGDSDSVMVGDVSVAIGNPLSLQFQTTVTQGIISGVNRVVEGASFSMDGLLQTDASINPGNSGGPLLNSKGQVIGINTAKTENAEGIGFAIPINVAKPIVEQVIKTGSFDKVTLGIKGMSLAAFESLVGADLEASKGVYVVEVEGNTAAKNAGIRTGDVIESINGKSISDMNGLTKELYKFKSGDSCEIVVNRTGEQEKLKVKFKKSATTFVESGK